MMHPKPNTEHLLALADQIKHSTEKAVAIIDRGDRGAVLWLEGVAVHARDLLNTIKVAKDRINAATPSDINDKYEWSK